MIQLTNWNKANKLTLNADKSSFTFFRSSKKTIPNLPDKIEFLNHEINRAPDIKFLGIILDEHSTWNNHINEICNKLKRFFHIYLIFYSETSPHTKLTFIQYIYSILKDI